MIIGVTGKSGSGKSTYSRSLSGFFHVSFDEIGHEVIDENRKFFEDRFGTSDRKKLGELVFVNRDKYKEMSDFCWERMQKKIDKLLNEHKNVVLDFILLPHTKYWSICDKKVLVISSDEKRRQRVLDRDHISEEYFDLRDLHSIEYNEEEMDEIINN